LKAKLLIIEAAEQATNFFNLILIYYFNIEKPLAAALTSLPKRNKSNFLSRLRLPFL
jgi:hypothetical protein